MSEKISEEYLWRKVKIHTFLITPAAVLLGYMMAFFILDTGFPPIRTFIIYTIGAYIGVTIMWLVVSEDKQIERQRKAELKRRRKSKTRRVVEFFAIIGGAYLILRLISHLF
ncbi:hypothetical protein MM326_03075 [Alkalihalobacillus sp. LMS6]|uniref:hypothetical protein n=1 Tax=Bacillaceae TaxID=186817 RepID=UPI000C077954|nr:MULTISPECIES: hypothetical protein [Bacillaceae]UTR07030.1 hypothetical protein MM326_03075 [Alkalihalobacillus sp. LMS6]